MEIAQLYELYKQHPSVQTDTRKLQPGDIFFALSGPNFDGNTFAKQALEKGASYVVLDNAAYAIDKRCIVTNNALETLQQLAKYHRQQFDIPFIAITGSNGKTTTKELIAAVLKQQYITYATVGNLNNHIGVPLTLLSIHKDAEMAIIEMGANHQKEIASYCQYALPNYAVINNIGKAHIEGFGGEEGVRKGKGELYDFIRATNGHIFINSDLDYLAPLAMGINQQFSYGSNASATCKGIPEMKDVFLSVNVSYGTDTYTINSQLVGIYNFPNVMAAVAIGHYFNIPAIKIKEAIEAYAPDNSRSQWMEIGSNKVVLDAYNANPSSMKAAIQNFANSQLQGKVLWLGGMREMGSAEHEEHQALVDLVNQYSWDDVILVGNEFKTTLHKYTWFENSTLATEYISIHLPIEKSILIKGSRGSKMELMANALKEHK